MTPTPSTPSPDPARVVMLSGGVASWATAKRVAERHGAEGLTLLFSDTRTEDEDTYRFLFQAALNVGGRLQIVADGRDVWQVFRDNRFIGNTRADICSRVLKRELLRKWLEDNCDPQNTVVYLGFGWEEAHRFTRAQPYWEPWTVEAPLIDQPFFTKFELIAAAQSEGLDVPELYRDGFLHSNCGGFCVKAGHGQFKRLLETRPETYAHHEQEEEAFRTFIGKDVSILRDRQGGDTKPLTLREFRERIEANDTGQLDLLDWGASCACMEVPA